MEESLKSIYFCWALLLMALVQLEARSGQGPGSISRGSVPGTRAQGPTSLLPPFCSSFQGRWV